MKKYYEILQVDKNADFEVINRVFKYNIKKNPPDLFTGEKKSLHRKKYNYITKFMIFYLIKKKEKNMMKN